MEGAEHAHLSLIHIYLATFDHFEPLSPAENAAVESVANELHRRIKIGCTGCRY